MYISTQVQTERSMLMNLECRTELCPEPDAHPKNHSSKEANENPTTGPDVTPTYAVARGAAFDGEALPPLPPLPPLLPVAAAVGLAALETRVMVKPEEVLPPTCVTTTSTIVRVSETIEPGVMPSTPFLINC